MGVDILHDPRKQIAVMYCNTEGRAFGPVFDEPQQVEDFLEWLREGNAPAGYARAIFTDGRDARDYREGDLDRLVEHWRSIQTYVGDGREPDGVRYLGGGLYGSADR